jgi:hypothetical protein
LRCQSKLCSKFRHLDGGHGPLARLGAAVEQEKRSSHVDPRRPDSSPFRNQDYRPRAAKKDRQMTTQTLSLEESLKTPGDPSASLSNKQLWAGRVLGGLPALFLLADGGMKLLKPAAVVEATLELGYPESSIVGIGVVLLASTVLYLMPRTAILGALLLTGYLGGAVATHVRVGAPPFNDLFPVVFGALLWGGLWLRDSRVRDLLPLRAR